VGWKRICKIKYYFSNPITEIILDNLLKIIILNSNTPTVFKAVRYDENTTK